MPIYDRPGARAVNGSYTFGFGTSRSCWAPEREKTVEDKCCSAINPTLIRIYAFPSVGESFFDDSVIFDRDENHVYGFWSDPYFEEENDYLFILNDCEYKGTFIQYPEGEFNTSWATVNVPWDVPCQKGRLNKVIFLGFREKDDGFFAAYYAYIEAECCVQP